MATKQFSDKDKVRFGESQHIGYGQQRTSLEDRYKSGVFKTAMGQELYLAIVADGIGGSSAGETAAQLVIDSIFNYFSSMRDANIDSALRNSILSAHNAIHKAANENTNFRGMGSTVTVAVVSNGKLSVANVGDSRAYLVNKAGAVQLTLDHTWGNEKILAGLLSYEKAQEHSRKDELARFVGQSEPLEIDLGVRLSNDPDPKKNPIQSNGLQLEPGDTILICSDGLTKDKSDGMGHYVEPNEMVNIILRNEPKDAANTLVAMALGRRVDDNVTVVLIEMPGKKSTLVLPKGVNYKQIGIMVGVLVVFLLVGLTISKLIPVTPPLLPTMTSSPTLPAGNIQVVNTGGQGQDIVPGLPIQDLVPGLMPFIPGTRFVVTHDYLSLNLPAGTTLYLAENTSITIDQVSDPQLGTLETDITLQSGSIMIKVASGTVIVKTPAGNSAEVSGSLMGVEMAPYFYVDCYEGHCQVNGPNNFTARLQGNQFVYIDNNEQMSQSDPDKRCDRWRLLLDRGSPELGICGQPTPKPYGAGFQWNDRFSYLEGNRLLLNEQVLYPISALLTIIISLMGAVLVIRSSIKLPMSIKLKIKRLLFVILQIIGL